MDTALLAFDIDGLEKDRLVRPFEARRWMQALDGVLSRILSNLGRVSSCFSGETSSDPANPMPPLLLLPIAYDARYARMDQVLVHAPGGFDESFIMALHNVRQVAVREWASVLTVLVDIGHKEEFLQKVEHFGISNVWQSVTPCLLFEARKSPSFGDLEPVLRSELAARGFPWYSRVEIALEPGRFASLEELRKTEDEEATRQFLSSVWDVNLDADEWMFGLRLYFDEPVRGPMVLGVGGRHGMGQFLPAPTNTGLPVPHADGEVRR
mgnify:CR=1 FL=1